MTTLQTILQQIQQEQKASTSANVTMILSVMEAITKEVIKLGDDSPPQPDIGALAACEKENARLKDALDRANGTINWQADIIHKIGAALLADDLTAVQLVTRAAEIMTELNKRRRGHP